MSNGLKLGNGKASVIMVLGVLAVVGIMLACAPPQSVRPLPQSSWGGNYLYSWKTPEKKSAASVPVTIAIVAPNFSERANLDPVYRKVVKGFSKSMAIDFDKIIVAKGMTVTGPFESLDMMTYPDKKNADLSLTPEITVNVQNKDITGWRRESYERTAKTVKVKVDVWVKLMLREPLSSEKIWIKKIEVGEMAGEAEIIAARIEVGQEPGFLGPVPVYGAGKILYDGRPDAVANIIKKMYPKIMQTVWRYINTEEILVLKDKAKEIRELKRY